jgi:hypothetical protein
MCSLAAVVRLSIRQNAAWRPCARCLVLAPLAPDQTHCSDCRTATPRVRRRPARAACVNGSRKMTPDGSGKVDPRRGSGQSRLARLSLARSSRRWRVR